MNFPTMDEVRTVVFSIDGDSVVGPDGFTSKFFIEAWEIVAEEYKAVLGFFCGDKIPRCVTATWVVLNPKIAYPQDFSQFRPTSLCNFINKIISRVLADRLVRIIPCIISPQQSGFVKDRQINDNFSLAQEVVGDIGRKNGGYNVVLKLDIAKAYDRVSWI